METYKTPKLIAKITPIFSFSSICNRQMRKVGKRARVKSMPAEYAAMKKGQWFMIHPLLGHEIVSGHNIPPAPIPISTVMKDGQQLPGALRSQALSMGVH